MIRPRTISIIALFSVAGFALVGCAPDDRGVIAPTDQPTASGEPSGAPAPAGPDLEGLALTTEGFGPQLLGAAPDDSILSFDAAACDGAGLWTANYPDLADGTPPFAVGVIDDEVSRIDVSDPDVFTDMGLHVGSSLDEILGVYPGGPDEVVNHADVTDVYVFLGIEGKLQFEVAVDRIPDYWPADQLDTVVFMNAVDIDTESFGVAASDNVVGVCETP